MLTELSVGRETQGWMPIASVIARTQRRVVSVRRQDVREIAEVGGMWFIRTTDRLYVTHKSWYPQFNEADLATMRNLLIVGWLKSEIAIEYGVPESTISRLFEGDRLVSPARAARRSRKVRFKQRRMKPPKWKAGFGAFA